MGPENIDDLARKPNGLVLVTGPTGAGKPPRSITWGSHQCERRCKIVTIEGPARILLSKNKT